MKTSRFLLGIFALAAVVGCSKSDEVATDGPLSSMEKSYISISLKSTDDVTRADGAAYEDGTADEQAVEKAAFFFFDAAGSPFKVNADGNYINITVADNGGKVAPNIESMTDPVLVVEKYKGQFPASVAAVVNYTATSSLSLGDLKNTLTTVGHTSEKNFIMSNSVYVDGAGTVVDATPLTIDNFQTSSTDALAHPVTVYVERVVAKVNLNAGTTAFNTGVKVGEKEVFVKILGWNLVGTQAESYYVKSIDNSWTDAALGFVWNDAPYFRSYWAAKSVTAPVSNAFTYSSLTNNNATVEYVAEQVGAANTDRTKFIAAGALQDAEGNAIELAQWYGVDYIGETSLLAAVAPTLKSKLMYFDGTTYTSIDDSQLECVAGLPGAESYEVSFQLAAGVATDNWFSFDGANYTPVADVNAELAKVEPAKIYKSGMTYYYGDIKHLGSEGKVGEFGIVRNHSYKINVTGVKGLGTPVYDPEYRVENPQTPTDKESYISAKINVLSWRVVSSDVIL